MARVRDIMQTDVISVRPEATVAELVQLLDDESISGVPVVDSTGTVRGVVSRTDVVRHAASQPERPVEDAFWYDLARTDEDTEGEGSYFLAPESAALVLRVAALDRLDLSDITVRDIMTPVGFSVDPDMMVWELADFLVRGRIHRALVVEEGRLAGIATAFDVLKVMAGDNKG